MWFAFELVSLNHWKQLVWHLIYFDDVVICFRISIFEPLKTTLLDETSCWVQLWFAFELVSLNHWKQQLLNFLLLLLVVICFRISIFEPLKTTSKNRPREIKPLWFAFELVSLNHWKQPEQIVYANGVRCDLLSN